MANRDELLGINMPRASYAVSGWDWAKEPGAGAPMIINSNTPGQSAKIWSKTYGSSLDAFLSIIDGGYIESQIDNVDVGGVYRAIPNIAEENIWSFVDGVQQIQYVVSGEDIEDGRARVASFGALPDARGLCMRLPMMAMGWGKTKEMLPLVGTSRENPPFIKMDRNFWNAGTVDLRWDEKRKVWGAWNDLIADHESVGLGTPVFSTNPDGQEGFPYLKGRLEDVWWVRQLKEQDGSDGKVDGASTAKVMTHLEHYWYDDEEKGAAQLKTIFIIPHEKLDGEDDNACHEKGDENELGDELTGTGKRIDIKHDVHFWKELNVDGPIKFGDKLSEIIDEVSCDDSDRLSVNPKYYVGQMIFLDDDLPKCDDDPGEAPPSIVPGADKPPCEWVPAIQIDECQLVGGHFATFYGNDAALAEKINTICVTVNSWSKDFITEIESNLGVVEGLATSAYAEINKVITCVNAGFADLAAQLDSALSKAEDEINSQLSDLVTAIIAALQFCGCEISDLGFTPDVQLVGHGTVNPSCPTIKPPISTRSELNEYPCSNCFPTQLQAPCANNADEGPFSHGGGCDGNTFVKADYEDVGRGQAVEAPPPVGG